MTDIDVVASRVHYWRHLAPIVSVLRDRGHDLRVWGPPGAVPLHRRARRAPLSLCASWSDARVMSPQRCAYVEHGAGQSYIDGDHEDGRGYAGAGGLDHVVLFVTPGESVADRWRSRYPQTPVESVGSPALDQHLHEPRTFIDARSGQPRRVVITEHWRCGAVPETMPALRHFERGIRELVALQEIEDLQLVGHAHPRGARRTLDRWRRLGVTSIEPDADSALRTADLLVADNTSLMYEAAALEIPVLALNAPTYRPDVEHGLRFWSHVPGIQCDSVGTFVSAVMTALDDPLEASTLRARAASHVYAARDGRSAERAADAIEKVM